MAHVLMVVALTGSGSLTALPSTDDGNPDGEPVVLTPTAAARLDAPEVRWVWDHSAPVVAALWAAGVRLGRGHEIRATERLLQGRDGEFDGPVSTAAVVARAAGRPAPADPEESAEGEPMLFGPADRPPIPAADIAAAYRDQRGRAGDDHALRLLIAAESASTVVAAEMGLVGLPLRAADHRRLLERTLGPRPLPGGRPAVMQALAARITEHFGHPVNPDSPVDLREAFRRAGFDITTTRSWVIKDLDHPAVPDVLEYKERARLFSANGWNWLDDWVKDDRFHAEYLAGGVVSGRWATRGGGALQIPRPVRTAVRAEAGHSLVVADAAQLEPRVLAAVAADPVLAELSVDDDLYTALAADGFGGDRAQAKLAMLGAMYGQTSGEAGRLLPVLRRRYPAAMGFVEDAAHRGERGESVRSVLGRASPFPNPNWWAAVQAGAMPEATAGRQQQGREVARAWGRFTRNFVVQASAADWAAVWLSVLRRDLIARVPEAELVFFQHDELIVHVPTERAEEVSGLVVAAADEARALVFPGSRVSTPVRPVVVQRYSDAK